MPGLNTPPLIDFRSWAVFGPHTKSDLSVGNVQQSRH